MNTFNKRTLNIFLIISTVFTIFTFYRVVSNPHRIRTEHTCMILNKYNYKVGKGHDVFEMKLKHRNEVFVTRVEPSAYFNSNIGDTKTFLLNDLDKKIEGDTEERVFMFMLSIIFFVPFLMFRSFYDFI